jgi:deoxyribonuclease V
MRINHLHDWTISPGAAINLQLRLVKQLVYDRPIDFSAIRYVAGVDVGVRDDISQAAVVVLSFPDLKPVETVRASMPTPFPYVPGLLTFREGPVLEKAFALLEHEPDAFIFDGMGRAHPRRIGLACHMGLWLGKPSIGCGKGILIGKYAEPPPQKGKYSPLMYQGEVVGAILRSKAGTKPVYISVGHLADLESAVELTMRCLSKYRLPEPIRLAHHAAGQRQAALEIPKPEIEPDVD